MRKLILVKHANPLQQPSVDARNWRLSPKGQAASVLLAEALRPHLPAALYCSQEPKATETAQLAGAPLGLVAQPIADLHEHDRRNTPYFERIEDFDAAAQRLFAQPDALVYGHETASAALARFSHAIARAQAQTPMDQNAIVVAHGTVITLFVAAHNPIDPFAFWKGLALPSVVVLTWMGQLIR